MISPELVLTVPMASRTGHVAYLEYVAGSNKGGVRRGQMFNSVWSLGEMDEDRSHYTGQRVVETVTMEGEEKQIALAWTPAFKDVESGKYDVIVKNRTTGEIVPDTDYTVGTPVEAYDKRMQLQDIEDGEQEDIDVLNGHRQGASILRAPNLVNKTADLANNTVDTVFITLPASLPAGEYVVSYVYDNIVIPQNDIPQLNARMAEVTLEAHARRIAIYYSQIANFQAKQDYGFDLGDNLAKQAIGELQYEIDSEIVAGLRNAVHAQDFAQNIWSKTPGVGVSLVEHYQGFAKMFDEAATQVYLATQKFTPNYMVCARDVITVLSFLNGWNAAPLGQINGPYFAGTYNGVKVYVSPMLTPGEYFLGVNGSDMQTSAAVYGIYMPVVPTQLLGFADGAMSQGFSTLYDFKILSKLKDAATGQEYSPLLVGGKIVA